MADDTQVIQVPSLQTNLPQTTLPQTTLPQTTLPSVTYNVPQEQPPQQGQASSLNLGDLPAPRGAVGSHPGRGGNPVQNIILHSSDGREAGDLNTLTTSSNAGAHYYVTRAGQIIPLVSTDDTAFHAGRVKDPSYSNESTVGIEQEHYDPGGPGGKDGEDWPDAQVQATARLVAALQQKFNLKDSNVLTHSQVAFPAGRKQDPYNYPFDKFNQLVAQARGDSPTQVAQQQPLTIPPIVYPWQLQDPDTVTFADIFHQQQQRETGNIAPVNISVPTQTTTDASALDNQLAGALSGHGADFVAAGQKNNVDPRLVAAISMFETGNGTSEKVQNLNNPAGIFDSDTGQYRKFGSVQEGIDFTAQTLREKYLDQGLNTIEKIGAKYAPVGAANDPNKTNAQWPGGVSQFYAKLGGTPGSRLDASQTVPQQISATVPGITYPWQTASTSPDQVNQAVRDALKSGNAFASTEPGVPAGYNPNAQVTGQQPVGANAQKPGLVLSQEGNVNARTQPENFGMRVATPDDVQAFDQWRAKGGDPNTLDPYDLLALSLARNPGTLTNPANKQLLDEMVVRPQEQASAQKPVGDKVIDAIGAGMQIPGQLFNAGKALVGAYWKDALPSTRYFFEKLTGQKPDPDAISGAADLNALQVQGMSKAVSEVHDLINTAALSINKWDTNLSSALTNDPQKLAELRTDYLGKLQHFASENQFVSELGDNLQGKLATAYSTTGALADLGQKLKTAQADPQAVEGYSQLMQILAPGAAEGLMGMKAVGAFRPMMAERVAQALEDSGVARARKFMYDSTQVVPRDVEAEAANPNYFGVRNAQAGLASDTRAADAASTQENVALQQKLTSLNKISLDPGTATNFQAQAANVAANVADWVGAASEKVNGLGDRTLNALSLGSPTLRGIIEKVGGALLFSHFAHAGHAFWGRLAEFGLDAAEHADQIPKAASQVSDFFKTYGKEAAYAETSVPFWTRMSQGTRLVSPRMAAFLDSPAIQTIAAGVKGAPAGMATGAFIGALSDPNDPLTGAVQNAIPGGMFGMVGGGFGQWQRYGHPGDVYLKARGDWKRSLDMMAGPERDQFLSLQPKDQLMLGTYLQQVPGLRVNFANEPAGVSGSFNPHVHTFDGGGNPAITINTANPEGTVRGIFAHELMHATQRAGMTPDIYDALLGNADRGEPGQYTALDAKGNPLDVNPATGRYSTNQEFQNFKNDYIANLARSGEPTSHLSDLDIARELFAEHGVDHLLSAKGAVDATSAFRPGWVNENMLKDSYAKLGFTFDRGGNLVTGTHLFDNLQANDAVDKLTQKFWQTRFRNRAIESEEMPTRTFRMEDLRTTNAANTFLDTAPEIMRNQDGSVMRDARGVPIMRTPAQTREYNAKFANDLADRIEALPEERKNDINYKIQPNGNIFVRYLPAELRDALAKSNQYNPHQIKGLNAYSEMLADNSRMGTNFRLFYNKALTENKRYAGFQGTEKYAVPYGFAISRETGQVNLQSVDFDQLNQNYLRNASRAPFQQLWKGTNAVNDFTQDWNTYFQNHARGDPGATGIGDQKRDAINSLLGLSNGEVNPILAARGRDFPGVRPIIKSYRIDRTSQITPLEMTSPFTTEEQYYRMNRNFRPGMSDVSFLPRRAAAETAEAAPPDKTAIPVTMRETRTGKQVPEEIPYNISAAPLVANKQPSGLTKDSPNDFSHVDFLGKLDQQRLTHLDNASATGAYAKKLIAEYAKWKDNPDVMAAKPWYNDVRGHLETAFGDDAELFAHLLAATSPRQGVAENWHDALEAYRRYRTGAFDDAIQRYKDTGQITEDMKPKKENGAKFGMNSDAVLKVLAGTWLDSVEGPKTPNFFENLFGRGTDATIDSWAARTMRRLGYDQVKGAPKQWRIQPASEPGVSNLDFAFSQEAYRRAADKLGMDPHELQAVMWYAEKHHWAEQGWAKGGAAAAKASYVPMLKSLAENVKSGTPLAEAIQAAGKK